MILKMLIIPQCSPATSLLHLGLTEAMGSLMSSCENDHIQQAVTECLLSLLQIPTTKNRYVGEVSCESELCEADFLFVVVSLLEAIVDYLSSYVFRCLLEHGRKGKVSKERFD